MRQNRQLRFDHIPDQLVINICVAVDEDVAESDDSAILTYARDKRCIQLSKLRECLADDFELALNSGAKHRVTHVVIKRFSRRKLD